MSCDWDPVTSMYVERVIPPWVKVAEWNNNRGVEGLDAEYRRRQLQTEYEQYLAAMLSFIDYKEKK